MSCEDFCKSILQLLGTGVVCTLGFGLIYVVVKDIVDDLKGKFDGRK